MKLIHILVAEDNDADVILFQEALQHHQIEHQLYVAADGQAALDVVAEIGRRPDSPCPDVMLLDLNLPKVDGPTVLEEFRKRPQCQHTPVIIVTSSDAERDRARVGAYGPIRYFRKPSDFDAFMELGAIILEVINEQAQGQLNNNQPRRGTPVNGIGTRGHQRDAGNGERSGL